MLFAHLIFCAKNAIFSGTIMAQGTVTLVSGDDKVLRSDNGIEFIEFAKQRFIDRYKSGKIGVSSRENGISYINQFAKFLKQEHHGSHGADNELLYLGEITVEIIVDIAYTDASSIGNVAHGGLGVALFQKHPFGNLNNLFTRIILFYLHRHEKNP